MANFLEQLTAEYYSHMGYFVKTNVKFGLRKQGGYEGEMDVIAFHPESLTLLHIETSMDSDSWKKRKEKFQKKFLSAEPYYRKLFRFEIKKIKKMIIVGFNIPKESTDLWNIAPVQYVPYFIEEITGYLSQHNPLNHAISENFPLLRAMQFAIYFDNWRYKKNKL